MNRYAKMQHREHVIEDYDWDEDLVDAGNAGDGSPYNKQGAKRNKKFLDHKTRRKIAAREARKSDKWSDDYAY